MIDPPQPPTHPLAIMGATPGASLVASVPRAHMGGGDRIRIYFDDEDGRITIDFRLVGTPRPFGADAQPSLPGPNLLFAINAAFSMLKAALDEESGAGGAL